MKLSPAFLAYKLSSAFSVLAPENLPLSGTLELPVLYQTGSAATAHRVFTLHWHSAAASATQTGSL